MFALDNDIFTLLAYGHARVQERHDQAAREKARIGLPVAVRAEVLKGRFDALLKAADGAGAAAMYELLVRTEREIAKYDVWPFDDAAAAHFDVLRTNKKLRKVGVADLLVASIALARGATLVTRNVKDFQPIPDLTVENWAA